MRFEVRDQRRLTLEAREPLASMYLLSPYVWRQGAHFEIALRAVNRSDDPNKKIARVYHGRSGDSLHFVMDRDPLLAPGPDDADAGGCEDPSVIVEGGIYNVFYSGYNPIRRESQLLWARGDSLQSLLKLGTVFSNDEYKQTKEATPIELPDHSWRLFFEYAHENRSKIGIATSKTLAGPWTPGGFALAARPGHWDNWHLSPGPIVQSPSGQTIMFYNGGTRLAQWRVGFVELTPDCRSILSRSSAPLIEPGPVIDAATDIAFAASALSLDNEMHLYYTISDMTLMRAVITFV